MEMDKDRCSPDHLVKLTRSIAIMKNQLEFMKQYQEIGVMAPEWQNLHHLVEKAVKQLPLGDMEVLEEKTDLSVRADPMFEKVVYNLIENVIRHSDGAKHLHISVAEKDGSISLVFQDDGRGVTSKEREHLFQSGHGKNTGFGLFLSKEILEITGLTITEEDTEGKGAKFSVGVPLGMYRRQVRDHTLPDE
jgi:signal transduction histidine kinase